MPASQPPGHRLLNLGLVIDNVLGHCGRDEKILLRRVMGDGAPKYLNSPETRLFDKSRNLYGLNYARSSRKKYMLICEGYMDVIAMHQAGFTNAVASLGTAFTSQHAMLIKRYTDQVILTYDSDGAGVKAVFRVLFILSARAL